MKLSLRVVGLVSVSALAHGGAAAPPQPKIAVLEVQALHELAALECDERPTAILLAVSQGGFTVAEELHAPLELDSPESLRRRLKALKDARPERVEVALQIEDGVSYARVVSTLDTLIGLGLLAPSLVVSQQPAFTETAWARPAYREFLPEPPIQLQP